MNKRMMIGGVLAALMLAGCGNTQSPAPETTGHDHVPAEVYSWNGTEHWHACECGEKLDAAAHNLGEDVRCAECGLEVWDFGDGYVDVISHDEYGNMLAMISYDPDGNVITSYEYKYGYDELGNIMRSEFYSDGVLQNIDEFLLDDEGNPRIVNSSSFYEGETDYMEYDELGNIVYSAHYDSNGDVTTEAWSDYAVAENGDVYESHYVAVYEDGMKVIANYNSYGDNLLREIYDADGNLTNQDTWEYGYNEDGRREWVKEYEFGVLVSEIKAYAEVTNDWGTTRYPQSIIDYFQDGTKLVTFYGTNTMPETETMYNADGSVAYERTHVYETFEDGNWKRIQVYQDGTLIKDTEYVLDGEYGWSRKLTETEYHEDGTRTVYEYDENEQVSAEKHYDADGNEI